MFQGFQPSKTVSKETHESSLALSKVLARKVLSDLTRGGEKVNVSKTTFTRLDLDEERWANDRQ